MPPRALRGVWHPVKHSASPAMQNAGIADLGLNWRIGFEVHPENCGCLEGAKVMDCGSEFDCAAQCWPLNAGYPG